MCTLFVAYIWGVDFEENTLFYHRLILERVPVTIYRGYGGMKRIKEAKRYKDHDKDVRNQNVAPGNTAKWQGGWVEMFALVDFN